MTEKHHQHRRSKSATRPTQLLIFIQKYETVYALGQQTWTVLAYQSPKQTSRSCQWCWNREWTAGDGTHGNAMQVCIHVLPPPSALCAEVMVKLRHRRCIHHVDATCNKLDNRRYILKTDYRLETGYPLTNLPFNKPTT